jgi:hypothetical protein
MAVAIVGIASGIAVSGSARAPSAVTPQEAHDIAAEAYLYFNPLVSMDVSRRQGTKIEPGKMPGRGPMNTFSHLRAYPDANFGEVARPNFDTLYSSAWLDLTKGPVIVSVPDTHGRYYLLPMLDVWTDVFAAFGKRTSGTTAANYAVVPPGWTGDLPAEMARIQSPAFHVWIIGRTRTNGPGDYAAVHAVQDGHKITLLAQWGRPPQPVSETVDPSVDMKTPRKTQVDTMKPADYFHYAEDLMTAEPPHVAAFWSLTMYDAQGFQRPIR